VPFEYPRSPQLRFTEPFARLAGQVSACLRGQPAPANRAAGR
jgi:hypothetical protein